jgi:hypothetical protein
MGSSPKKGEIMKGEGSRFQVKRYLKGFKARAIWIGPIKGVKSEMQRRLSGGPGYIKVAIVAFLATKWEKNRKKISIGARKNRNKSEPAEIMSTSPAQQCLVFPWKYALENG